MIAIKLAFRNLIGAGLRTWLNVSVLSFAFVLIIFYNGMMDGWYRQGRSDTIEWETGNGQLWHKAYDRYDPFTIQDSHGVMSDKIKALIKKQELTPVLMVQASAYPQGRMESVLLKGIDPGQKILKMPVSKLKSKDKYCGIIGQRMAKASKLKEGDMVLIRWRDKNGTFDAREIRIAGVFDCNVPSVDNGQIWLPLDVLQEMTEMKDEATLIVTSKEYNSGDIDGWKFKDLKFLLSDLDNIVKTKKSGGFVIQFMLLFIALLAIFDTQVLSIFRRQKEIGTYIALGMTRLQVVGIFTFEGAAHSILAAILGALWGIPLLLYINTIGIRFGVSDMGITISDILYPYYGAGLIIGTIIIVVLSATVVSYIPARRISKMNPTDALKGKLQ
jgi:putative ABC transport system permease protein